MRRHCLLAPAASGESAAGPSAHAGVPRRAMTPTPASHRSPPHAGHGGQPGVGPHCFRTGPFPSAVQASGALDLSPSPHAPELRPALVGPVQQQEIPGLGIQECSRPLHPAVAGDEDWRLSCGRRHGRRRRQRRRHRHRPPFRGLASVSDRPARLGPRPLNDQLRVHVTVQSVIRSFFSSAAERGRRAPPSGVLTSSDTPDAARSQHRYGRGAENGGSDF